MLAMAYSIEDLAKNLTTFYDYFIYSGFANKINAIKFGPFGESVFHEDTLDGKQIVHVMDLPNGEVGFIEEFTHDEIVRI